jgi:hypothetical protein
MGIAPRVKKGTGQEGTVRRQGRWKRNQKRGRRREGVYRKEKGKEVR